MFKKEKVMKKIIPLFVLLAGCTPAAIDPRVLNAFQQQEKFNQAIAKANNILAARVEKLDPSPTATPTPKAK